MEKIVLDTNFFFNLQEIKDFGKTTKEVLENITFYIKNLYKSKKAIFYIPPSVVKELKSFFEEEPPYLKDFLSVVQIKSPDRNLIKISGNILYEFVKEMRKRSHRALKIAEEEIRETAKSFLNQKILNKIDFEKKLGERIRNLRERYRNATRTKFLDSQADVDLILLAKELNAFLISTDEGLLVWADKIGIKILLPQNIKQRLENLLN